MSASTRSERWAASLGLGFSRSLCRRRGALTGRAPGIAMGNRGDNIPAGHSASQGLDQATGAGRQARSDQKALAGSQQTCSPGLDGLEASSGPLELHLTPGSGKAKGQKALCCDKAKLERRPRQIYHHVADIGGDHHLRHRRIAYRQRKPVQRTAIPAPAAPCAGRM